MKYFYINVSLYFGNMFLPNMVIVKKI